MAGAEQPAPKARCNAGGLFSSNGDRLTGQEHAVVWLLALFNGREESCQT